jgi:hypothetical protein
MSSERKLVMKWRSLSTAVKSVFTRSVSTRITSASGVSGLVVGGEFCFGEEAAAPIVDGRSWFRSELF